MLLTIWGLKMRDIQTIKLADIVPDSILSDPNVEASVTAIDGELSGVSNLLMVPAIISRIDELTGEQLNHLSWQFDTKVWRESWPVDLKRSVIKTVIKEKSKKGTRSAVKGAMESLGSAAFIKEWWEYSPETTPYTFDVTLTINDIPGQSSADMQQDLRLRIDDTKPARSHYTLNLAAQAEGFMAFSGAARVANYRRMSFTDS